MAYYIVNFKVCVARDIVTFLSVRYGQFILKCHMCVCVACVVCRVCLSSFRTCNNILCPRLPDFVEVDSQGFHSEKRGRLGLITAQNNMRKQTHTHTHSTPIYTHIHTRTQTFQKKSYACLSKFKTSHPTKFVIRSIMSFGRPLEAVL